MISSLCERNKFPRILNKSGKKNVKSKNIPQKFLCFCKDFVHTLIEASWQYLLLFLLALLFGSWTFFGVLYMLIAWSHGDLSFDENGERLSDSPTPCIIGATKFSGFFLLSVESQVSTG